MIFQLCCICIIIVINFMLWKRKKHSISPPNLPGKLPLLGHAHLLLGNTQHAWEVIKWAGRESVNLGGVASIAIGPKTGYVLTDPDDCAIAANACLVKDYAYGFAIPWLGEGFLTGSVELWKKHRRLMNPAFTQHTLNGFMGVFNKQSRKLVSTWTYKKGYFKQNRDLSLLNLDTICQTSLGIELNNASMNNDYENALEEILYILTERFKKIWLHSDFIYNWSSLKRRQTKAVEVLHKMTNTALQMRKFKLTNKKNQIEDNVAEHFKPFLDIMIDIAKTDSIYSDNLIRENVDNIIFAGHDTASTATSLILAFLGSYPKEQDKVYHELQNVFGNSDRDVEKDDLPNLQYLEAFIKEVIRLCPLGPVVARNVETDVKLRNYTIKAGSSCYLFYYGLHRHPIWGPDADQFRPGRWLDPSSLPQNPNAYAAFSLGRKSCVGKAYAMMLLKITLVHVLRRYKISSDVSKLMLKLEVILKPVSGFEISLDSRC